MEKILNRGLLWYLTNINPTVLEEQYEPVSYEHWKLLRDLEPSKFRGTYDEYVETKREQFEYEKEQRKKGGLEINSIFYMTQTPEEILKTKESITKIETNPLFSRWVNEDIIEQIKLL